VTDAPGLQSYEALSFDCYGTLIDWETGLIEALEPLLARVSQRPSDQAALEAYAQAEGDAEAEHPADPYPEILSRAWLHLAKLWGVDDDAIARDHFARSVGNWPAFPDSSEALTRLKARYKLIILSNVDRASFALTNRRLGVAFDKVITAQDLGSYKPDPRNFEALVGAAEAMGVPQERLLHVAQSLYHDHLPAQAIGLRTAWIDRREGMTGGGATLPPQAPVRPDFTFPSLSALVDAVDCDS